MADRILVVLLDEHPPPELHDAIAREADGRPQVRVVAPIRIGALDWLATDETGARAEAAARALEAEWALADEAEVEGGEGELDPELAVEDALRAFPADLILLVGGDDEIERALRRSGVPVRRIGRGGGASAGGIRRHARSFAAGRGQATPFVALAAANLALLALAALISVVVLLVVLVWLL